jgi:phospholipase/lecithinase/hemolysin
MKKINILLLGIFIAFITGCTYTFPEPEEPTSGSANFSKVVVVGNSLSAGFMDGALYDAGQQAAYANIVATQMQLVGGGEFNQPDIDSPVGNFGTAPDGTTPLGHLVLRNPANPAPAPIVPGDPFNTSYSGDKSALNNFAVPGMRIVHAELPGYGAGAGNPYFARFASSASTTVLADAIAADGSFIIFWLGGNDALGYATAGAIGNPEGDGLTSIDMTAASEFDTKYRSAISKLITDGKQGILANVPNVSDIPYFTTVPWNSIPMDQATADATNGLFAGLNGALEGLKDPNFGLDPDDLDSRKVSYSAGNNAITMHDSKLVDLGPYYDILQGMGAIDAAQRAALEPFRQSRPMTPTDLVTLTAGSVLGTEAIPGNPASVIGVGSPLAEQYSLTAADIELISTRIAAFNASIKAIADASSGNIAIIDINTIFADFAANGTTINGSGMDATIFPPFGAFSLDGIHPNQRGNAFVASLFIDQINEAFNANIPNVNPNNYPGNALPIP